MKKITAIIAFFLSCEFIAAQPHYTLQQVLDSARQNNIAIRNARHDVDAAITQVCETVRKIERKDFSGGVQNRFACEYCDMKYYCRKEEVT